MSRSPFSICSRGAPSCNQASGWCRPWSIASLPASSGQPGSIAGFQLIARHLLLRQPGDFARRPIAPPFRSGAVSVLLKPSGSAVRALLRRCQFCAFPACRRNRTLTCRGLLSESAGRQRNHPAVRADTLKRECRAALGPQDRQLDRSFCAALCSNAH